jgi:serine/threonine-protein kinase
VVEVLDAGADERGVPFVVLERLYGEPLESLIDSPLGVLPVAQAIVPVLNALVRLHLAGIIHRDLKPSNIFLGWTNGERLTPKLLDFGIAKALEGSTATSSGIALGTPAYMAPEQALGSAAAGPTTDVWSIGVVLARCLTGKLPFELSRGDRFVALRQGLTPADLPGVPEPLAKVIANALRFEPGERTRDIVSFRSELLAALREHDPSVTWPNETSVSYTEHECELARRLAINAAPARPTPVGKGDIAGRPEHVMTKTIDIETHTSARASRPRARRPPRWRSVLAILALGTATTALLVARANGWRRPGAPIESSATLLPTPSGAVPAASGVPTTSGSPVVLETAATPSDVTTPSNVTAAIEAASAPITAPSAAVVPPSEPAATKPPPSAPSRPKRQRPRSAVKKEAAAERSPNALGANRSPIIE